MMQARLKAHWSVGVIRDEITLEKVGGARMVVFGCPRDKFSVAEVTNEQGATLETNTEISIKDTCFSPIIPPIKETSLKQYNNVQGRSIIIIILSLSVPVHSSEELSGGRWECNGDVG